MAELVAKMTCPACGWTTMETMPIDYCLRVYQCGKCAVLLKPKAGDCCVFCSYADYPCPSVQESGRSR